MQIDPPGKVPVVGNKSQEQDRKVMGVCLYVRYSRPRRYVPPHMGVIHSKDRTTTKLQAWKTYHNRRLLAFTEAIDDIEAQVVANDALPIRAKQCYQ